MSESTATVTFGKDSDLLKIDINAGNYIAYGSITFRGLAIDNSETTQAYNFAHAYPVIGTLAAGKYHISGNVKETGEVDFTLSDLSGTTLAFFTYYGATSIGTGRFSGTVTSPPKLGLSAVSHYSEYTDQLVATINAATQGGPATANYFNVANSMSQLFQPLANTGRSGWSDATDSATGLPVKYVAFTDEDNKLYYIKVAPDQIALDANGDVVFNGSTATVKGVDYNGIGMITMTCGYDNYTFSKTSWWLGTSIGGTVASKVLWGAIGDTLKSVAGNLADKLKSVFQSGVGGEGGNAEEEEIEGEDASADSAIEEEVAEVAVEEVAEEGAIALGDVFIGVGIVLAVLFIVLSFILHNTYHSVRVWNLTKYSLNWTIHFDSSQSVDEGQLVTGPVVFDSNNNITKYGTFLPVSSSPPVPGTNPVNQCHYGDLSINSSHEFSGIGYVLQFNLTDSSGNTAYKATMYFDIPFSGDNSTNVSLDPSITDLQQWYDDHSGDNMQPQASTTSDDGVVTLTTTYDYLSGKHPVPNTPQGQSSNLQYFYQSVVTIVQTNLSQLIAEPVAPAKLVPVDKPNGLGHLLKGVRPSVRKEVLGLLKKAATVKK
jgi:hypothetical protein